MNRKWWGRIVIISAIVLIFTALCLAIYYNNIKKDHEGPMEPWAIVLMVIPLVTLGVSMVVLNVMGGAREESVFSKGILGKIGRAFLTLLQGVIFVIFLPLAFIFIVADFFFGEQVSMKTRLKKLIRKGFVYKKDKKYILTRDNIVIEIGFALEDYYISFDFGEHFVRIEESELGTSYERQALKQKLEEYKYAHPVDKQRGDAVPPITDYVEFLNKTLE